MNHHAGAPEDAQELAWREDNRRIGRLIVLARDGDTVAFEALYGCTARWLLSRVRRFVDDGQAEDVLAEVYLQVWRTLHTYDEQRAAPRVWLAMIARSRAFDHLRREKRRGEVHDCPQLAIAAQATQDDGPEQLLSRAEQARLLQLTLADTPLSVDERTVLGLAYFREHTQQEISVLTGFPLGTVKTILARAQSKLRARIAGVHAGAGAPGGLLSGPAP